MVMRQKHERKPFPRRPASAAKMAFAWRPVGCGPVHDANASAGVQQEVERLRGLRDGGFDPEQAFAELEGYFGGSVLGGLRAKQRRDEGRDGPEVTHEKPDAGRVPEGVSSELWQPQRGAVLFPAQ